MANKPPNRRTRKNRSDREPPKSLGELVGSELATGPSDPGARAQQHESLLEQFNQALKEFKEFSVEQSRAETERLKIVVDGFNSEKGNKKNEKPSHSLPPPALWVIILVFAATSVLGIVATINPNSVFPSEIQVIAGKGIASIPGAIVGFFVGMSTQGKRD
jgi:hypothetical protein